MRLFSSALLALMCFFAFAANPVPDQGAITERISSVEDDVRELQLASERSSLYYESLEGRVDNLSKLQERSSAVLANELEVSNRIVSILAIIFAIVAVFLGFYVTWMERKIKKMKEVVEDKEAEAQGLVEMVNSNLDGLYERIHRADTVALLKRLIQVPKDIANIATRLLSTNLEESDFTLLKSAFEVLIKDGEEDASIGDDPVTYGERYLQQFFQHFLGKSVSDPLLRDKIIQFFPIGIESSFTNDIDKSTRDLAAALAENNGSFDRTMVLYEYQKR